MRVRGRQARGDALGQDALGPRRRRRHGVHDLPPAASARRPRRHAGRRARIAVPRGGSRRLPQRLPRRHRARRRGRRSPSAPTGPGDSDADEVAWSTAVEAAPWLLGTAEPEQEVAPERALREARAVQAARRRRHPRGRLGRRLRRRRPYAAVDRRPRAPHVSTGAYQRSCSAPSRPMSTTANDARRDVVEVAQRERVEALGDVDDDHVAALGGRRRRRRARRAARAGSGRPARRRPSRSGGRRPWRQRTPGARGRGYSARRCQALTMPSP